MTGIAVLIMLLAIVIIWGGLAVSITALISRGRREDRDARAEATAPAREHKLHPEQTDSPVRSAEKSRRDRLRRETDSTTRLGPGSAGFQAGGTQYAYDSD